MTMRLADFVGRINIPVLLSQRDYRVGAEVGVHRAEFSLHLLLNWTGRLICIDNWKAGYDPEDITSGSNRKHDYHCALANLQPYQEQVTILRLDSLQAAEITKDGFLDFVYVDACHQYKSVKEDLHAWYPKIRSGGILFGHDFLCPGEVKGGWGRYIQPAVLEFAEEKGLDVWLISEGLSLPWSYYMEVP